MQYLFIILIATWSLQACNNQPAEGSGSASDTNAFSGSTTDKGGWLSSLNEAQEQSVKRQKSILIYFTDSDTCRLCTQLETNVFDTPTFETWAEKNVVLLKIDISTNDQLPENNRAQNTALAQSLKVANYPTSWILNITHEPENNRFKVKPVGTIAYQDTPEKYIGMLQNLVRR